MAHVEHDKVGLVLAGGGARGAYEAGALSVLLPMLEERGQPVRVIVGTSVGAISAALLGAHAQRGVAALVQTALARWRDIARDDVLGSLAGRLPRTALEYFGQALGVPGVRVQSLLDTTPLQTSLDEWIRWDQLHANVVNGEVESVAVVATRARDGRSVVFADSAAPLPASGEKLDYIGTRLTNDHVRASAAIPIVFPPIRVEHPPEGRGWYFDGGTRLNTPIKPAIDQGAGRVVVIALDSIEPWPSTDDATAPPSFADAAAHLLDGALADPLLEDIRTLARVNALVESQGRPEGEDRTGQRTIPYILIAPGHRNAVGELADRIFRERYAGLKGLRSPELVLLNQLLGGGGASNGALSSLLLFDEMFLEDLIQMGRRDARAWLDAAVGPDAPWHTGPVETRPGAGVTVQATGAERFTRSRPQSRRERVGGTP
jgi:NTE family protein